MFKRPDGWPQVSTLFFIFSFFAIAQYPFTFLIQKGWVLSGIFLNEWFLLFGGTLFFAKLFSISKRELAPFRSIAVKNFFWFLILLAASLILIDYLTFLTERAWGAPKQLKNFLDSLLVANSMREFSLKWFVLCVSPAVCEEFLFRGFLQPAFSRNWGVLWGMVTTAILFSLLHGTLEYLHLYFLLGFLLCWIYQVTQNLWFPILGHFLNNTWTYSTHAAGIRIPKGGNFEPMDVFVMGVCVVVLLIAARRFASGFSKTARAPLSW